MTAKVPNPIGPNTLFDETVGEFVRGYNRGRPKPHPEPPRSEFEQMLGVMKVMTADIAIGDGLFRVSASSFIEEGFYKVIKLAATKSLMLGPVKL